MDEKPLIPLPEKLVDEFLELLAKNFPNLSENQIIQFEKAYRTYWDWNQKINVISRKDIENLALHHFLHSLSIAKFYKFKPNTTILDIGTGGGFPGIPLAIFFPEVQFTLIDSIKKKIKVVEEVVNACDLQNVEFQQIRVEDLKRKFDFMVSRAVTQLDKFESWVRNKLSTKSVHAFPNSVLYLKGGNFQEELKPINMDYELFEISEILPGDFKNKFFDQKYIVQLF